MVALILRQRRHQNQEDHHSQDSQENREFGARWNFTGRDPIPPSIDVIGLVTASQRAYTTPTSAQGRRIPFQRAECGGARRRLIHGRLRCPCPLAFTTPVEAYQPGGAKIAGLFQQAINTIA